MIDGTQTIHRILIEELGVHDTIETIQDAVYFRWFEYDYVIGCSSPMWITLGITLHDEDVPGSNPLNRLPMNEVSRDELMSRISRLSGQFAHLVIGLSGERHLRIEWTGFLFGRLIPAEAGAVNPMPPGYSLPVQQAEDIAAIIQLAMMLLNTALRATFQAFGREPKVLPRGFPTGSARQRPDSLPLFRNAVQRNGYPHGEAQGPAPTLYFLDREGRAFRLFLAGHQGGAYCIQMEFKEADRFNPDAHFVNVIDGVIGPETVDLSDHGSRSPHIKIFVVPEAGFLAFSTSGFVPMNDPDMVRLLLPVLIDQLVAASTKLFTEAGVETLTSEAERIRRRDANPGIGWVRKGDLHRWEASSGSALSSGWAPQTGTLFSGIVIPTDRGEIQIDHVLVCEAGIFAVECKSYGGTIEGSRNGPWRQTTKTRQRPIEASWGANPADQVVKQVHGLRGYLAKHGVTAFVSGVVLFPNNAKLALQGVPINAFLSTAPAAFTLEAFVAFSYQAIADRSKGLTPDQVETVSRLLERS